MTAAPDWAKFYNLFNPMEKLEGERLSLFVERLGSKTKHTVATLRFSEDYEKVLLVGQRGSGKSTELRYLSSELGDDFFRVIIDIEEMTDIFTVNHVEILYIIGVSVFAAAKAQGFNPDEKRLLNLGQGLETLVREQTEDKSFKLDLPNIMETLTKAAAAVVPGSAMISVAPIFKGMKLGLGVDKKEVRRIEIKPQITKIGESLNELIADVVAVTRRKLFVVVDGLDRVEYSQARAIFAESKILTMPNCKMIYVVPAQLYHSPKMSLTRQHFHKEVMLPNIKLHAQNSKDPFEPGYEVMRKITQERLEEAELDYTTLFEPGVLDRLIKNSGGLLREFIRLVREAGLNASIDNAAAISETHAHDAIAEIRRHYMAGLSEESVRELEFLERSGLPSGNEVSNNLLQNLYILTQSNDDLWYEIHPVLADYIHARMHTPEKDD
jgi:hypothetical protein